jgi:hypothetical protein
MVDVSIAQNIAYIRLNSENYINMHISNIKKHTKNE